MRTYVLRFISDNVIVFNIGRADERDGVLNSAKPSKNFQAENDESAARQAKIFLNGFEEGGRTFSIEVRNYYFKRVGRVTLVATAPRERKVNFIYYTLFEELKREIRINLLEAKEEEIERLRRGKEKIEEQTTRFFL